MAGRAEAINTLLDLGLRTVAGEHLVYVNMTRAFLTRELYTALQNGAIDATEWVGPYNDVAFGLNKAARYYYAPGWWEPGPSLDVMFPADEFDALPQEYQEMLILTRRVGETLMVGDNITVTVLGVKGNQMRRVYYEAAVEMTDILRKRTGRR